MLPYRIQANIQCYLLLRRLLPPLSCPHEVCTVVHMLAGDPYAQHLHKLLGIGT
jgi:hypothetical protein